MLQCERLFGAARGLEVQAFVEEATGEQCPCKAGQSCPFGVAQEDSPRLRLVSA